MPVDKWGSTHDLVSESAKNEWRLPSWKAKAIHRPAGHKGFMFRYRFAPISTHSWTSKSMFPLFPIKPRGEAVIHFSGAGHAPAPSFDTGTRITINISEIETFPSIRSGTRPLIPLLLRYTSTELLIFPLQINREILKSNLALGKEVKHSCVSGPGIDLGSSVNGSMSNGRLSLNLRAGF